MANFEFTLPSGATLKVTTAPFEAAVALMEAVKASTRGVDQQAEVTDVMLTSADVRRALYGVMKFALYENIRVEPALFDDPKYGAQAREDYIAIGARLIEVNVKPFFLQTSSGSSAPAEPPATKSPESL